MRMKRLADYLSLHLLRKISIRYRLVGAFMLLCLLPLVLAGVISYAESTQAIAERTRLLSTEVVKQVAKNIELEMAKLEADSEALVLSDRVQHALAQYAGGDEAQASVARRELMRALLERYGSFDFINQKYLLDRDNRIIDTQVFANLGRGVIGFVENAPKLMGRPYWGAWDNAAGQTSLVLLRAIHNKADNRPAGSLFLGVRPSHFAAIFDDVDLGSGSAVSVLDAETGKTVVRALERPGAAPAAALAAELRRSLQRGQRSGFVGAGARLPGDQLAAYAQVADTSWFVVSTIPLSTLTTEAQSVRDKSILIGLAGLAISLALAALLARSIAAPLERLAHSMRAAEGGDYANRVTPEGRDELTVLARQFNEMAGKVDQHHLQLEERVNERTRDLAEANGKLAALSMTDGLTGIANRRRFDEVLGQELQRAARAHPAGAAAARRRLLQGLQRQLRPPAGRRLPAPAGRSAALAHAARRRPGGALRRRGVRADRRRPRCGRRAGAGRGDPRRVRGAGPAACALAARAPDRQHRGGGAGAGRADRRRRDAAHGRPGHVPRQGAGAQPGRAGGRHGAGLNAVWKCVYFAPARSVYIASAPATGAPPT
jgi:HAMP domain-containing protein